MKIEELAKVMKECGIVGAGGAGGEGKASAIPGI